MRQAKPVPRVEAARPAQGGAEDRVEGRHAMNPKVDRWLGQAKRWREEMTALRRIVAAFPLSEEIKWRHPCYSLQGKNVVLINDFKEYCALLFFKGALLKDAKGVLSKIGAVQAARSMHFTSVGQIAEMEPVVKAYVAEAIEVEKAGRKVKMRTEYPMPEEFKRKLAATPGLKTAFEELTPGRQRGYLFFFSGAKQSKTREARIEKCLPQILKGKGLDD